MNQNEQMQKKKMNIATAFRKWLLLLVALAFLATTVFLWVSQTKLAEHNAVNILSLNINDVNADIHDASDENLLNLAHQIADELNKTDGITDGMLVQIAQRYDVTEINYIDREGIIRATTYSDFLNYDMAGGEQSAAFLVLLDGENEYVQSYGPVSYNASISRKYGGAALANGGFVQIGYDAERFQKDISQNVIGVTRNRHVGKEGFLIIADENGVIVSDRNGGEGKHLDTTGILQDNAALLAGEQFKTKVYGQRSYCILSVNATLAGERVAVVACYEKFPVILNFACHQGNMYASAYLQGFDYIQETFDDSEKTQALQCMDFINSIKTGTCGNLENLLTAVKVSWALEKSILEGRPIKLK